jgi:hypothetical protein
MRCLLHCYLRMESGRSYGEWHIAVSQNLSKCVLYRESMFELVLVFELTLSTEQSTIDMQADLNMLVLYQD